jgi:adenine C2-methylase RlmN of 23S rRNA A2503 and tRNA A37
VALQGLTHQSMFDLSMDKVTISTVGVVHRIRQLADECPAVNLAISLHAGDQARREGIVPTARAYTLRKLGAALDYYYERTQRKLMMEYIVIGGVNDATAHAHELGA